MDVTTATVVGAMHLLCLFAPFEFNWGAFWVAVGMYLMTGLLCITLSHHRNLSHISFKLPKWLKYLFAYCEAQALQGNPIDWVSTIGFTTSFVILGKTLIVPLKDFGTVKLVGSLTTELFLKGHELISLSLSLPKTYKIFMLMQLKFAVYREW